MLPRLPAPPCHAALSEAVARLAGAETGTDTAGDGGALLVAPDWLQTADLPDLPRIGPDDAPPAGGLARIVALDLWSEAADPPAALARLRAALAPEGRLIVVQTNWPQRRGTVPPEVGGPPRSPDLYTFRDAVLAAWPEARLGLVTLDGRLTLHPLPPPGMPRPALPGHDAIAFVAATGPLAPAEAPPPPDLPRHAAELAETSPAIARGARRSLAFVIDVPDWAYANIVNHIAPHLAGRYDVSRFHISEYPERADLISALFVENRFDHVHFMWRELWFNAIRSPSLLQKVRGRHGLSPDTMADLLAAPVVTTTIYDHLFLTESEIEERRAPLALTDGYATASDLLARTYRHRFSRAPDAETPDGVNAAFFARGTDNPGRHPGRLRVGWVGNSAWGEGKPGVGDDPKGLHSVLKPAVDALRAEGRDVVLELADRNLRQRDRAQMRAYYAEEIDVLVCASAYEGTPNPVLEATASGRAWVSTDVGIVREVAGPVQAGLILPERSPEAMADALRRLLDDPALLAAAEAENRDRAAGIDWTTRVAHWTRLFAAAESRHAATGALLRREVLAAQLLTFDRMREATAAGWSASGGGGSAELLAAEARIASLEEWLEGALAEIGSRDEWIGRLQTRIAELEGWGDSLQTRIAELEDWAGTLRSRNSDLEEWNDTLRIRNAQVEEALHLSPTAGPRAQLARLRPRRVLRALRRRLGRNDGEGG